MNPPPGTDITSETPGGWRYPLGRPSLSESYRTVPIPEISKIRAFLAFLGPGYVVAVGYMDPGNWATDIAGGSAFGYELLSVVLAANFMAMLLQALSARLGIVTGRDLAQACRDHYSKPVSYGLWIICELAIIACDVAEVIGTAIALNLLFDIPLTWGVVLTLLDVLFILWLQKHNYRLLEATVIAMITITGLCFAYELFLARPDPAALMHGLVPTTNLFTNPQQLFIAIGILGATVMPHNLYLHSSIVQTRRFDTSYAGKKQALLFATIDSSIALGIALFINAAILILAASTFYTQGRTDVAEIQTAFQLLTPLLGTSLAATLFAVALLTSGLNSSVTATLAGQIVMEGFINIRLPAWLRRLVTRAIAIVPALICASLWGDKGVAQLLIVSQVILSMQLPFAIVPLLTFLGDKHKMGPFVIGIKLKIASWFLAFLIIALNLHLLWNFVREL